MLVKWFHQRFHKLTNRMHLTEDIPDDFIVTHALVDSSVARGGGTCRVRENEKSQSPLPSDHSASFKAFMRVAKFEKRGLNGLFLSHFVPLALVVVKFGSRLPNSVNARILVAAVP